MNRVSPAPCLQYVGDVTLEGEAVLPLFENKPRTVGKLDINTVEGWNALADEIKRAQAAREGGVFTFQLFLSE